jgi:hypothetical protein
MIRISLAALAIAALMVTTAEARGRRGNCCCDGAPAPAVTAQAPQAPTAPAQAERPQASRVYSYEPGTVIAPIGGNYGIEPWYNPPRESWGLRPASAKANANY